MSILAKKMLVGNKVTIIITTTPIDATCVITYNGIDYITNSLNVKKGSTITYTVSKTYYDTETDTITVNQDTDLSVNLSPTKYAISRPNFTGNGTMGSTTWAVQASYETNSNYAAWKAVDSATAGSYYWCTNGSGSKSSWYKIYYVNKMKITKLVVSSVAGYSYGFAIKTISIKGSNNNSNWTNISCSLNSSSSNTQTVTLTNTNFYKYYMLSMTHGNFAGFYDIQITGTYIRV